MIVNNEETQDNGTNDQNNHTNYLDNSTNDQEEMKTQMFETNNTQQEKECQMILNNEGTQNNNTNDEDNHTNAEYNNTNDKDNETNDKEDVKKHILELNNNLNSQKKRRSKMKENSNTINIQPYKDIIMGELKTVWRLPQVVAVTGLSKGTIYTRIADGLFPKQVHLGGKAIGWISTEVIKVLDGYAAGLTQEQIRDLVKDIHADRNRQAPTDGNDQPVPELEGL